MLFASLRNTLLAVTALCLVNVAFSLPLLHSENGDLVARAEGSSDALDLIGRDDTLDSELLALREELDDIDARSPEILAALEEEILEARRNHPIKVSNAAKRDIKRMLPANHSRQQYKAAKAWHRGQVANRMANIPGARGATIKRGAHSGGTNPAEPAHITTEITGRRGRVIQSRFRDSNGQRRTSRTHHVYTNGAPAGARIPHVP